ncbi:MAG TPA: cytochrome c peroxidase, partial [Acidimicrobiia bacterium]|nr:cytochrome c peroxidase [Acidimicrobiia bacterium]
MLFGAAAFVWFLSSPAPAATPDPLNPVFKTVKGPFRPQLPDRDQSNDPSPAYTEAERRQLVEQGKELFFSRTAWGQRPSQGPMVSGQVISCATCHDPALGFSDGLTHLVSPVREREVARRQTPSLLGVAHTAPYGWDGRNPTLQVQARGAIVAPLEMHASREPTKRELDALAEFQGTLSVPPAVPGKEYDPARAARGEVLFRTPRPVTDATGEFPAGAMVACATCHAGPFFTDGRAHRGVVVSGDPAFDPGEVRPDGTIAGFHTPSLLGLRLTAPYFHDGSAGDPTSPSNFLSGGLGRHSVDGGIGGHGSAVARRALLDDVLPFYNTVRF